mgnify:FL=1
MPNLANAKKALRQSKKRAVLNLGVKRAYKSAIKAVIKTATAGEDTAEGIKFAQKKLDKAAKKGVLKQGAASRKISRLMKTISTLKK